jgi:hypothetical protein
MAGIGKVPADDKCFGIVNVAGGIIGSGLLEIAVDVKPSAVSRTIGIDGMVPYVVVIPGGRIVDLTAADAGFAGDPGTQRTVRIVGDGRTAGVAAGSI